MPLIPIVLDDWWDDSKDTSLAAIVSAAAGQNHRSHCNRSWRYSSQLPRQLSSEQFQINLDVQQFSPEEISVKVIDNSIVVEAKHDEKPDEHGHISRHFVRRYEILDGHDSTQTVSSLSSDGVLTITVPKKALPDPEVSRTIPIVQTGQPMQKLAEKPDTQVDDNSTEEPK